MSEAPEPIYDTFCLVCGKTVNPGAGWVHFPFEKRMITLCCPLCYEAFKADAASYLERKPLPPIGETPG